MNLVDLALWWGLAYLGIALIRDGNVPIALGAVLVALTTTFVSAAAVNAFLARNEKLWRVLWGVPGQGPAWLPLVLFSLLTKEGGVRGRGGSVPPPGVRHRWR